MRMTQVKPSRPFVDPPSVVMLYEEKTFDRGYSRKQKIEILTFVCKPNEEKKKKKGPVKVEKRIKSVKESFVKDTLRLCSVY